MLVAVDKKKNKKTWKTVQECSSDGPQPHDSGAIILAKLFVPTVNQLYQRPKPLWPKRAGKIIHDSRVCIRRLEEILGLICPIIGISKYKAACKRLRVFRRDLGAPRSSEVLMERIDELLQQRELCREFSLGIKTHLEKLKRRNLKAIQKKYTDKQLVKDKVKLHSVITPPNHSDLCIGNLASMHLCDRILHTKRFIDDLGIAEKTENHHRLRIRIKRLRYTLEMLNPIYSGIFVKQQKMLQKMQSQLGALQDANELLAFLSSQKAQRILEKDRDNHLPGVAQARRDKIYAKVNVKIRTKLTQLLEELQCMANNFALKVPHNIFHHRQALKYELELLRLYR